MPEHVLVVDDSEVFRGALSGFLEEKGFAIDTADNGLSALERILETDFDMVFLDIEMPKMTGLQVCRLLRAAPAYKDLPIVLLTGRSARRDQFWGLSAGANAYLKKPFIPEELIAVLNDMLNQAARRKEAEEGKAKPLKKMDMIDLVGAAGELQEKQLFNLTMTRRIAEIASKESDLEGALAAFFEVAASLVDLSMAGALIADDDRDLLFIYIEQKPPRDSVQFFKDQILSEAAGALRRAINPQAVKAQIHDPEQRIQSESDAAGASLQNHSAVLESNGVPIGLLLFSRDGDSRIGNQDKELLNAIVGHGASTLNAIRISNRFNRMADLDPLTGVDNHSRMLEKVLQAFEKTQMFGSSLSVIAVAIDGFGEINARAGYAEGDKILKRMGQFLKASMRGVDVVGRYGGVEFLCAMPETPPDKAQAAAERMRQAISAARLEAGGKPIQITASFGVACLGEEGPADAAALIAEARRAMKRARAAGGNATEVSEAAMARGEGGQ